MKTKTLFLFLSLGFLALGQPESVGDASDLTYTSPDLRILRKGSSLEIEQTLYEYGSPMSSTPASQRKIHMVRVLKPQEAESLDRGLEALKDRFFHLQEAYGGPAGERFYGYTLSWKVGGKTKTVLFRSHPSYPGAPDVFSQVESLLRSAAEPPSESSRTEGKG